MSDMVSGDQPSPAPITQNLSPYHPNTLSPINVVAIYHQTLAERYRELLSPRFPGIAFAVATEELTAARTLETADVLLAQISFPGHLLVQAPRLGWVQVMGAGADRLLPSLPPHVKLSRLTGSLGDHMAEYAIGYVLAITQRVPDVVRHQDARHWEPLTLDVARGKTLGVAGLGSVGSAVARLGAAIGMRVTGYAVHRPRTLALDAWYPEEAFDEFLADADFVVLTLPSTPATRQIINRASLARMRPTAWLLNISRGALIDEAALVDGLAQGQLAGAVLDVFAEEPLPPRHPFWGMPNVIVTSHQSGSVIPEEVVALFAENLARYQRGEPLLNEVDPVRGY